MIAQPNTVQGHHVACGGGGGRRVFCFPNRLKFALAAQDSSVDGWSAEYRRLFPQLTRRDSPGLWLARAHGAVRLHGEGPAACRAFVDTAKRLLGQEDGGDVEELDVAGFYAALLQGVLPQRTMRRLHHPSRNVCCSRWPVAPRVSQRAFACGRARAGVDYGRGDFHCVFIRADRAHAAGGGRARPSHMAAPGCASTARSSPALTQEVQKDTTNADLAATKGVIVMATKTWAAQSSRGAVPPWWARANRRALPSVPITS